MNVHPRALGLRRLAPLALAAVIGAGAGAGAYALTDQGSSPPASSTVVVPAQPASSTSSTGSLTQLYKQDAPGVVDITVTSTSSVPSGGFPFGPPGQRQTQQAEGSGFVIDKQGHILTAEHVVAGATKTTDTAVIHVDVPASQFHPLALGDSSTVEPGQAVVAIGSPFGLPWSMTAGIVSATNRSISGQNCSQNQVCFSIPSAIQTDAAINHGNSGGPLIDVATNTVIGINDQIESDTQDNAGVGFAVPINAAKSAARTLIAGGVVRHAYVGIQITDGSNGGAKVTAVVAGSPAAQAGLKVGDLITAFDGRPIADADALTAAVGAAKPGEKATLTVRRGGATKTLSVTLGTQPSSPAS